MAITLCNGNYVALLCNGNYVALLCNGNYVALLCNGNYVALLFCVTKCVSRTERRGGGFSGQYSAFHIAQPFLRLDAADKGIVSHTGLQQESICVDFNAAFDTIDHKIMIQRLHYGIVGQALD